MTRHFDQDQVGREIRMQFLVTVRHFNFKGPSACSCEQVATTIRELGLGVQEFEAQFRRSVFNVEPRNQDDHAKNISFLIDRSREWTLSPTYDLTYAINPKAKLSSNTQMNLAGRGNGLDRDDIVRFAASVGVKKRRALTKLDRVGA